MARYAAGLLLGEHFGHMGFFRISRVNRHTRATLVLDLFRAERPAVYDCRRAALEQKITFRRPRRIVVLVDGNSEDQSAADAILQELEVKPDDLVIYLARFSGSDPA